MSLAASSLTPNSSPEELLEAVLDVSLTGINLLSPRYGSSGELEDFTIEYLSPAAQRMVGLPERPGGTARAYFPEIFTNGVYAFYRRVFETGQAGRFDFNYQADGFDNYFHVAARRSGELLVVSFTDTGDQDRSPVEEALRQSQAAEKAARAEAEAQRQRFYEVLMALPAQVAVNHGPDHVYELVNPRYQQLFPARSIHGKPARQALPELEGQHFFELLDQVYRTGEPFYGQQMPASVDYTNTGRMELRYFDVFFQALRNAQGHVDGILNFAYDVTGQVRARQQVEGLNQDLETRVQQRTRELEQARAAAETQRQRLERLFHQAPGAICILAGPELIFELVNPAYQRFFPGRELLGKPIVTAVPELADHPAYHIMQQVYQTGETNLQQSLLAPLARPDDGRLEDRYFTYVQQPRYDEQGRINGVLIFGFEVTELVEARKQTDVLQAELLAAARRQSQEREAFYQIFEQTPALIALLRSPGHRYEYVNPAYQGLFAGRRLVGLDVAEAVPEMREQGFVALLDQVYQTGQTYFGSEHLFVVPAHHGRPAYEAYFNFTYQAFQENGQTAGISIFAYEVTEQVLARREREAQQQLLQELFMQAPAPIAIFDGPELVYELINPAMQQIVPGRRLLGKPLLVAMPELADSPIPGILDEVYRTGETFVARELPLMLTRHQGGPLEEIYWTFSYQARRNGLGQVDGVMVFAYEVTDQVLARRRVEESMRQVAASYEQLALVNRQLESANEQLLRINSDLDTFVYTASHDLKAPILNIEGLLKALEKQVGPLVLQQEVIGQIYGLIYRSVNRFKATIGDLTEVARISKESFEDVDRIDVAAVLDEVLQDLEPQRQEALAQLTIQLDSPAVHFSRKNLKSILYNLLSNAIKYRSPDREPRIQVAFREAEAYLVLIVEDNGLGMDMRNEEKIFALFKRLHAHVEGTGIGLYIVKKMIENAGGKIEVESQVGVGSTFKVYFKR